MHYWPSWHVILERRRGALETVACANCVLHGSTIPAPKDKGSSRNVGTSGEFAGGRLLMGSMMGLVANPSTSGELLFFLGTLACLSYL